MDDSSFGQITSKLHQSHQYYYHIYSLFTFHSQTTTLHINLDIPTVCHVKFGS